MKMPKRVKTFQLDGDYKGFEFEAIVSMPMSVFSYLQTGNWDLIQAALKQILVSWNFPDEDGKPLPQPKDLVEAKDLFGNSVYNTVIDKDGQSIEKPILISAISLIPAELGMLIIQKVSRSITVVPDP